MKPRSSRDEGGFSLVVVIGIGIVATLFLTGLFSVVMPSFNRIAAVRTQTEMRNAAEAGIDWVINQYNIDGGAGAGIANNTYGTTTPWISIPSNIINPSGSNSFTPTVQVQVQNVQPRRTSGIYNSNTAYYLPTADFMPYWPSGAYTIANPPPSNGITSNQWRIITVRAVPPTTRLADLNTTDANGNAQVIQNQQASAVVKNLQVVLRPVPVSPFQINGPVTTDGPQNYGPNTDINAYNSKTDGVNPTSFGLGANIDSNSTISLPNNDIKGDVRSRKTLSTQTDTITGQSKTTIFGRAYSNSLIQGTAITDVQGRTKGQYYASDGTTILTDSGAKAYELQTAAPIQMPTIPRHPTGATRLDPITGAKSLGTAGTTTDYYIDAGGTEISLSGSKTIDILGPTRIYLEGPTANSGGKGVVSISGNGGFNNVSKKPGDLVIYYDGAADLDISGNGTFYGVIIAPNAKIITAGNGQIYDAVVGEIFQGNGGGNSGAIHYDKALANMNLFPSRMIYEGITWREF